MRSAVILATKGRPAVVAATLESIGRVDPSRTIFVVGTCPEDLAAITPGANLHCVIGPTGLTRQRNFGVRLALATDPDLLYFFDDDIELHRDYFTAVEKLLTDRADVVAGSGTVLINGDVTRADARERLQDPPLPATEAFRSQGKHWILYGCNMFIRARAFDSVEFDERLPLYSWGEDYAVSIALRRLGLVGRLNSAFCVHLHDQSGRINWRQLAFAMSTNVYYFYRSGCVHRPGPMALVRLLFLLTIRIPVIEVRRRGVPVGARWNWWRGWLDAVGEILLGRSQPENLLRRCEAT